MRIVIDLQAAQESGATAPLALAIARDVARSARDHELWIILNSAMPAAIPAIRAACAPWVPRERMLVFEAPVPLAGDIGRRNAAQLLREHWMAMLAPDRVLVAGLPGAGSEAVVSPDPARHPPTAILLHDAAGIDEAGALLGHCALLLAGSEAVSQAARAAAGPGGPPVQSAGDGAAVLAALLAIAAPAPATTPAVRIGLVSDSSALASRLAHHGPVERIGHGAGSAALAALAPACGLLLYHQDGAADAARMLAQMEAHPGVLWLQSMASPCPAEPAALFEAHGYPGLLHGGADYPGNLALLRAAGTVVFDDAAVAATARRVYGPYATRNWLAAGDDAALAAVLATLRQRAGARAIVLRQLAAERTIPLPQLAYCLAQAPDPLAPRQLLVDVTAIVQHDLKTGIERVVRTQLLDLLRREPAALRVEPVYLSDQGGRWHYRYARTYALRLLGLQVEEIGDAEVDVRAGDIFYGADYSPHALAAAAHGGLFDYWRARGVALNFLIYDLLPVLRPEFFPASAAHTQAAWLRAVASHADRLLCISSAVKDDLAAWLNGQRIAAPALRALHLGADLDEPTDQSSAKPAGDDSLPTGATSAPAFLMVGTIEPRKGHLQTIAAFDQLWAEGVDVNLVIIGHEGWRGLPDAERRTIPQIVARLQAHPQLNRRLFWLRGPSDAVLRRAYADCACLIAASEGEGFGLPLIEAALYGLPVLARDLPVFREVAQGHASYFSGMDAASLAAAVQAWLAARVRGATVASAGMPWQTWRQNVDALLTILQDGGGAH